MTAFTEETLIYSTYFSFDSHIGLFSENKEVDNDSV